VVKRKMGHFPTKARAAPGPPPRQRFHYRDHIQIVAPAMAEADPAIAAPRCHSACQARANRHAFWLEHVRTWRASGLPHPDYAQRTGLNLHSLNQGIARLRHIFRRRPKAAALT
jgi:hypothetical protein